MAFNIIDQPLTIRLQTEEIVFLADRLRRRFVIGTAAVLVKVAFLFELFAALAVKPFVRLFDNQPLVINVLQNLLYDFLVFGARSADEIVKVNAELDEQIAEIVTLPGQKLVGRKAACLNAVLVLLPVFVGAVV